MKKTLSLIMLLATMAAGMATLTSCEDEDDYIAQQLRDRDWQGRVDTYYKDRWGITGDSYRTVMRFESAGSWYTSGRGYEVDYNLSNPYSSYAYCSFSWCIVNRDIYLIYDDDAWSVMYIQEYGLNDTSFWGYIDSKYNGQIRFDFINEYFDGWGNYNRNGHIGDFENQNWYRYRSRQFDSNEIPFLDRTEIARQKSGNPDAVSIASGEFAKAMMEQQNKQE